MILAFGREMESALNEVFLRACIDWLTAQLTDAAPLAQDDQTENIVQITGQMLSHLISVGWSFESLFQLYRRAFAQDSQHTPEGEAYDFARALRWLFARVARAPKDYVITFTINQVATGAELPNRVGDIVFSPEALRVSESSSAPVRRVAQAAPGRIFATMTVEANDSRIAGMRAAEHRSTSERRAATPSYGSMSDLANCVVIAWPDSRFILASFHRMDTIDSNGSSHLGSNT